MSHNVRTQMPVTVTLDLDAFAEHFMGQRHVGHWDDDEVEPVYAGDPIMEAVVARVQAKAEAAVVAEAIKRVNDHIDEQVRAIVAETLNGEFIPMTEFGSPRGPKTTLREMIAKQATDWFGAAVRGDSYNRKTNGQEFIAKEVDRVVIADCKAALESNREAIVARIKDVASTFLAAEVTKR